MSRLAIVILIVMLTAGVCAAQTTTVTGTITDPNGNPYANGTASAIKSVGLGLPQPAPTYATTNAAGLFTLTLASPASYQFTICAAPLNIGPTTNATPKQVCFTSNPIAIAGASQDVSTTLNPLAPQLGPIGSSGIGVFTNLTVSGTGTFTGPFIDNGSVASSSFTQNTALIPGPLQVNPANQAIAFNTEYQLAQTGTGAADLFDIGFAIPSGGTAHQSAALGIYESLSSTSIFGVGLYIQARPTVGSVTGLEAINPVFLDAGNLVSHGAAAEFDCNVTNTSTSGSCVQISGGFPGALTSYPALHVSKPAGGGNWTSTFSVDAGASPYTYNVSDASAEALNVNTGSSGNGYFTLYDGGNVGMQSGFQTTGGVNFFMQARNNLGANNTAYPMTFNPRGGNVGINIPVGSVPAVAFDVVGTIQSTANVRPTNAGGSDLGAATNPWGNLWIGTAATNNFKFSPATTAAARTITIPDPLGNDTMAFLAATQTLTNKTLNVPLSSGTGLQIFNTTTTCTTAGSVGATCTTAAISLPVAEADTSYRVVATCKGPTAVPVVSSTANSSATQFTITIAALTAVAASCSSFDVIAGHN